MNYLEVLATIYIVMMSILTTISILNFLKQRDIATMRDSYDENKKIIRENNNNLRNEIHIWKDMYKKLQTEKSLDTRPKDI
mgnify:CR=1 FL=1